MNRVFAVLSLFMISVTGFAQELPLAGTWRFEMDRTDCGKSDAWFKRDLMGNIRLPGSMAENHRGDPVTNLLQRTVSGWTNEPVWHPLVKTDYRGVAWYQKTVTVPVEWQGRFVELFLERVCWQSELWVDDKYAGKCDSLSAPHQYELGTLTPGEHRLTLRIDNRRLIELGWNTHAYHEQSCTIYNGAIGRLELRARPAVFVRANQVYADPATGLCELRVTVANKTSKEAACNLTASVGNAAVRQQATVPPGETLVKLAVQTPMDAVKLWGEFEQPLYEARVTAESAAGTDKHTVRFGFRDYTTRGTQFFINGKPVLLRGEVNCAQFPLTGYPPMEKAEWLKIFKVYKDFGLNHFRCHAWTPPEAAFDAADEVGIYLQPEFPNNRDDGGNAYSRPWRLAEFDRIIDTYGNHPSFVQMTMGNEANESLLNFLKTFVVRGRERDSRHLYASISNPEAAHIKDEVPGDDFAVAHGSAKGRRRMEREFNRQPPETMGAYRSSS